MKRRSWWRDMAQDVLFRALDWVMADELDVSDIEQSCACGSCRSEPIDVETEEYYEDEPGPVTVYNLGPVTIHIDFDGDLVAAYPSDGVNDEDALSASMFLGYCRNVANGIVARYEA